MFAMEEYNKYQKAQERADDIWKMEGETKEQIEAQNEANALYENWEYSSGIKSYDY